jgi:WD40-like Beta Propeller Repeat
MSNVPSSKFLGAVTLGISSFFVGCASLGGAAPTGSAETPSTEQASQMAGMGKTVPGLIVWSSSRAGNHDLYTMNTDGSDVKAITNGDTVDWFPRFSPDGSRILFSRSKQGWVSERDANQSDKWDVYSVAPDGSDLKKEITSASWASWIGANEVIFVRGTKILQTVLGSEKEEEVMDSTGVDALSGALLQQPERSSDGKHIAITLRGSKRETGVWDIEAKTWTQTGLGCQIDWLPDGSGIYWVNPTGNGGSEVFRMPLSGGKPEKDLSDDALKFVDLPGRRSHEYFPKLTKDGRFLVWGATQRGHDHDTADYEIYIWEVGKPAESAVRLTYHSGNDRWPDLFVK